MRKFIIMMLMLCVGWSAALAVPGVGETKSKCKIEIKENVKDVLKLAETKVLNSDYHFTKLSNNSTELKSSSVVSYYYNITYLHYDPGVCDLNSINIKNTGSITKIRFTNKSFMRGNKFLKKDCPNQRKELYRSR